MCGIAGLFDPQGTRPVARSVIGRMNDTLRHRGPDGDGIHTEPGIGLGHRRLAIIDLSGGAQPLANEDGTVTVVFNGEIYNFRELAAELQARGHRFRTSSDTEVIVHGWEEWGERCVERFRGMFAFAIWDSRRQTLFLARDRLGIKPLYYAQLADGMVAFGSELKAILALPGLRREIDPTAVEDFLALGYVPDPKSIYRGVRKLAPGHRLAWRRGAAPPEPERYWDLTFRTDSALEETEIGEQLLARLRDAVDVRLISEVPLGAFLSGGVDSSAVVAMMAGLSQDPVNTCAISFSDPAYDESEYARLVSDRYGTSHHVERVEADSFDLLDRLAMLYDEPFADSSAIPTFYVCQLARERVTVALSGDGGDELFAGYRRYRWHENEDKIRRLVPAGLRAPIFGSLGRIYPKLGWAPRFLRAKSTLQAIGRGSAGGYFHGVSVVYDGIRESLYTPAFRADLQSYYAGDMFRDLMATAPAEDNLSRIQYVDFKTYLPGDILTKVDRASMAHSLEVRVPLLDHQFIEWATRIPAALRQRGRNGKYIFKKSLEPLLPDDVLYRPKMGFAVPLAEWFRGPLRQRVRDTLSSTELGDTGMFDMARLMALVDAHQAGEVDHSAILWSFLMFESFLRQVHGASPAPLPDPAVATVATS